MNRPVIALIRGDDGSLQVAGPVDDLVACLGLLEIAKQLVIKHNDKKAEQKSPIMVVPGSELPQ